MKPIPRLDDLHPDGVRIVVAWDAMKTGMSVFIPCINTEECKKQIEKITTKRGWTTQIQIRIEDGRFGLRMWRTL